MSLRDQLSTLSAFAVSTNYLGSSVSHRLQGQADSTFNAVLAADPTADIIETGSHGYTSRRRMVIPTGTATLVPHRSQIIESSGNAWRVMAVSVGEFFTTATLEQITRQNFGDGKT